jgi:hypothetical protein
MTTPAKTSTERVVAHRARVRHGGALLQVSLTPESAKALRRLAKGSSKTAVINDLLTHNAA